MAEMIGIYEEAGYKCIVTSAVSGMGLGDLRSVMKDKTSLLSGNSGVGKSTLINALEPGMDLRVLEISEVHEKGQHATTFAEMHELSFGGFIIDTPGIREFGLIDFDRNEVAERFPEFRRLMHDCKYSNCQHIHEPGCAVKEALEKGDISLSRYESYLKIYYGSDWENNKLA
jgi:ribosome biogenesis GTPase